MHEFSANTVPFHVGDMSICGRWFMGVLKPIIYKYSGVTVLRVCWKEEIKVLGKNQKLKKIPKPLMQI